MSLIHTAKLSLNSGEVVEIPIYEFLPSQNINALNQQALNQQALNQQVKNELKISIIEDYSGEKQKELLKLVNSSKLIIVSEEGKEFDFNPPHIPNTLLITQPLTNSIVKAEPINNQTQEVEEITIDKIKAFAKDYLADLGVTDDEIFESLAINRHELISNLIICKEIIKDLNSQLLQIEKRIAKDIDSYHARQKSNLLKVLEITKELEAAINNTEDLKKVIPYYENSN
jgi:hypothetical protein